ncbi:retrovirus-related Pol polyprotein from type-1 retrotransposable element R2 [Caerostris darwini]|uniref:Retrovirus-related Pol polyprotein from type-1 retrotransposable element R2 n=1 Tax=Caerostris darwini TaxID=1538125 RepID=A0AAV4QZT8_9ARAC|nr:retrovirus-related Pol polyprotein from type-1 retrotransposable element R2 [Caerostris darwini]
MTPFSKSAITARVVLLVSTSVERSRTFWQLSPLSPDFLRARSLTRLFLGFSAPALRVSPTFRLFEFLKLDTLFGDKEKIINQLRIEIDSLQQKEKVHNENIEQLKEKDLQIAVLKGQLEESRNFNREILTDNLKAITEAINTTKQVQTAPTKSFAEAVKKQQTTVILAPKDKDQSVKDMRIEKNTELKEVIMVRTPPEQKAKIICYGIPEGTTEQDLIEGINRALEIVTQNTKLVKTFTDNNNRTHAIILLLKREAIQLLRRGRIFLDLQSCTVTTPLSIPSSRRRRRRKNRRSPLADSPSQDELQVDADQSLAQPVPDSPVPPSQDSHGEEEKGPLDHYIEPLDNIFSSDPSDDSFQLLADICSQIIAEGKTFLSIPEPSSSVRSQNGLDIQDPETCQKLYRRNRRRAVREIVGNNKVARALRSSENTAQGPDRLTYQHWRSLDPSAQILTRIFNVCLHHQLVLSEWKESTTILLPKDGDPDIPSNWRPIALSNTIYKLFMKCVAQRFKDWLLRYDVLSSSQKGFMPHDGVLEHNFLMHKRFEDARTMKRELCLAWLDVTNA